MSNEWAAVAATPPPPPATPLSLTPSKEQAALAVKSLSHRQIETFNAINAWREIAKLETILGLDVGKPIYHMKKSKERLKELNTMLAEKQPGLVNPPPFVGIDGKLIQHGGASAAPAATAAAPAVAPLVATVTDAAPEVLQASLSHFRKMDAATRLQFSQDGGALALADFNQLSALAKMQHCRAGGKILESAETSNRAVAPGHVAVTPHP